MKARKLQILASKLSWSWNKKYIKPLSRRRTPSTQKKGSSLEKLKRRREALKKKKIREEPKNQENRPKNGYKTSGSKSQGAKKVAAQNGLPKSCVNQKVTRSTSSLTAQKKSTNELPLLKVIGYKVVGAIDDVDKNVVHEKIKHVYYPKPAVKRKESVDSETEYLSDSDDESDRLPKFTRSPSPERRPICSFLRKGPLVDKPLINNRGFFVVKNGRMVKTPEFSIPYRPVSQDSEETPKDIKPPRKKLELPPLDELPTEFYDSNGKLIFKHRKPNVAGLMLLEAGLISFPQPERNNMADLDFPALRDKRLLEAMETLKFTD